MSFSLPQLLNQFPATPTAPRPYVNHVVELKRPTTAAERVTALEQAGLNVFYFPAAYVTGCDMLSDSGTTAMTSEQWASLHLGDEAYGSNRGYFTLAESIREVFGADFFETAPGTSPNAFLFHQGRAAEDALFSQFGRIGSNLIIPSNGHFDTTRANIEANGMTAQDFFSLALRNDQADPFKGNMDVTALEKLLAEKVDRVPLVMLTITNNTGGGQPVALENIRTVAKLAHAHNIPLVIDACRFAENAWFIRQREPAYAGKSLLDIVHEIFSLVDGFTISFKKDGLVNMGGGLFLRQGGLLQQRYPLLADALMNHQILKEGHPTYGGMSGRDIMALAVGLRTVLRPEYLAHRVGQVQRFGEKMTAAGLPVITPIGGHAVYMDMNKFFAGTNMQPGDFGGIAFTALLLAGYGHRACELGNFAFGTFDPKTGQETFPELNVVRFAVPRLRYEDVDLQAVVEACAALHSQRDRIPGVKVLSGKDLPLRHFKARFAFAQQQ